MTSKKRALLQILLELRNKDSLFLSETLLNPLLDADFCSLFAIFHLVKRTDRVHGFHFRVIFLCRRNSALNISGVIVIKNYDFVVAATLQNSHFSLTLFNFCYLPRVRSSFRLPFDFVSICLADVIR